MKEQLPTALILAAGYGSRIASLTGEPKSLLQISGRSILQWHIAHLRSVGVCNIVVVVGYKQQLVRKHLATNQSDVNIEFVENVDYQNKGAVYSLYLGLQAVAGDLLIIDADLIYEEGILARFLDSRNQSALIVGLGEVSDIESSKILVDDENRIRVIADKRAVTAEELGQYRFAGESLGLLYFSAMAAAELRKTSEIFFKDEKNIRLNWEPLLNFCLNDFKVYAHLEQSPRWVEIDTPEDYSKAVEVFTTCEISLPVGVIYRNEYY